MGEEPLANMRGRVEQCRRLAKTINDPSAIQVLLRMAEDIEADIARLSCEAKPADDPRRS